MHRSVVTILELPKLEAFSGLLAELSLPLADLRVADLHEAGAPAAVEQPSAGRSADRPACTLIRIAGAAGFDGARTLAELARRVPLLVPSGGTLVLHAPDSRSEAELASWRNALWPRWHAAAWYRAQAGSLERRTVQGKVKLDGRAWPAGDYVVFRERLEVMSPRSTVEKFDQNAKGWDGDPASPDYAHHRWMRRFVGCYASVRRGVRVLDFGSGAGWCGIEAALRFDASAVCAFDPSPQMVEIAKRNAQAAGVRTFEAQPGFGEAPPFPRQGMAPFDLVISSGVISFVPQTEPWLDGLVRTLAPGGTLVIGDIDPRSSGFQKRKREKLLLPVRELNGRTPAEVRGWLEQRGLRFRRGSGYQLSKPFPQAMEFSKRRLGGWLHRPLLWANQIGSGLDRSLGLALPGSFDSWVMEFEAPLAPR
jgi:SAM-dependent methyltransferase